MARSECLGRRSDSLSDELALDLILGIQNNGYLSNADTHQRANSQ